MEHFLLNKKKYQDYQNHQKVPPNIRDEATIIPTGPLQGLAVRIATIKIFRGDCIIHIEKSAKKRLKLFLGQQTTHIISWRRELEPAGSTHCSV